MAMENLHPLFGDNALAETTISGLVGGIAVQGQIDRLVVTEKKVMVADFKTGLPPASPEAIPQSYIRQMALYGHLVGQIYLDKEVECMLIWTQNLSVSIISEVQRTQLIEQLIAGQTK
jgi:ATP-dependent helicase/nuclease subunit A